MTHSSSHCNITNNNHYFSPHFPVTSRVTQRIQVRNKKTIAWPLIRSLFSAAFLGCLPQNSHSKATIYPRTPRPGSSSNLSHREQGVWFCSLYSGSLFSKMSPISFNPYQRSQSCSLELNTVFSIVLQVFYKYFISHTMLQF